MPKKVRYTAPSQIRLKSRSNVIGFVSGPRLYHNPVKHRLRTIRPDNQENAVVGKARGHCQRGIGSAAAKAWSWALLATGGDRYRFAYLLFWRVLPLSDARNAVLSSPRTERSRDAPPGGCPADLRIDLRSGGRAFFSRCFGAHLVFRLSFRLVSRGVVAVLGATIGGTVLFLATRTALGDILRRKAGSSLQRFSDGFQANAFAYMLLLRITPIFPFFLVNIAPGIIGISVTIFTSATLIGILPATFAYAWLGNGLDLAIADAAAEGRSLSPSDFMTPEISYAIVAIAVLTCAALYVRHRLLAKTPSKI